MELLFFAVFVKASPQDEHGVERPALSQGCGGGAIQLGLTLHATHPDGCFYWCSRGEREKEVRSEVGALRRKWLVYP